MVKLCITSAYARRSLAHVISLANSIGGWKKLYGVSRLKSHGPARNHTFLSSGRSVSRPASSIHRYLSSAWFEVKDFIASGGYAGIIWLVCMCYAFSQIL